MSNVFEVAKDGKSWCRPALFQASRPSGLDGMEENEAESVKHRLRLRLGIMPQTKMVPCQAV